MSALSGNGLPEGENLYHVVFTTSHISKDVNGEVERVRVCGTYTTLPAAKAAAHRTLFEAGYEKEMFDEYETSQEQFIRHHVKRRTGLCVLAKSADGTVFRVSVATTPNSLNLKGGKDDHKIHQDLYHVVQTNVLYTEDDTGAARETNVEGTFTTYEEARKYASQVLLAPEDGVTKESFEEYDEAGPDEKDCGFGENVVVHAVGQNGENYLVSVLRGQEMESVRLAEAAVRIRAA
ncbi:hypothetical protein A1O1_03753 [Capronia coronata CBS 617.96]|uniref:Uncharacterized protein n=1 Tax=Capronia coronata CBS 617.96 TaxID=1182541 RepID=W9Z801_9EURO|nr:uncharacterized protein A1O1_03753 [Capronia coronata CBS 617.96]EXJ90649.1 hypothetical protein A1O1_03753 [Capronia coronata CBS 617.96]